MRVCERKRARRIIRPLPPSAHTPTQTIGQVNSFFRSRTPFLTAKAYDIHVRNSIKNFFVISVIAVVSMFGCALLFLFRCSHYIFLLFFLTICHFSVPKPFTISFAHFDSHSLLMLFHFNAIENPSNNKCTNFVEFCFVILVRKAIER